MRPRLLRFTRPITQQLRIRKQSPFHNYTRHSSNTKTQLLTIAQPWLRLNCSLGEGPFWEEDTNTLRFLDVEKQKVHRVDLNVGPSSHKVVKDFDISIG